MLSTNFSIRSVSILGCGWYGMPLAQRLVRAGFQVKGSTTREEKLEVLDRIGIEGYLLNFNPNLQTKKNVTSFFDTDALVLNIPPGLRGESSTSKYLLTIDNLLPHILSSPIQFVIFISSTSVYANLNKILYEDDAGQGDIPINGKALLSAESIFMKRDEFNTSILRFGGLYGPNRHPVKYFSDKTNIPDPDIPTNLVHLEDCIRLTERVIRRKATGQIFNVVCDEHPNKKLYYTESARILGYNKPHFASSNNETPWKIISNKHVKQTLGYQFKFKSPFEGLQY